jgi:3-phosphoshikimate 1-carboxyvinyltransferase
MTLQLMQYFGATADWQDDRIEVEPGGYQPRSFTVEADWSAASYWYAMAAFSDDLDLRLGGLFADSWQGDSVLAGMMQPFGIQTDFEKNGIHLTRTGAAPRPLFEQDFLECPDIAQTLAVVCGGLGVQGLFSGLETLSIKETDRVAALKTELAKVGVSFVKLPPHFSKKSPGKTFFSVEDQAAWSTTPQFATYGDHRMAMAFAPLAMIQPIEIQHPEVVSKSYPAFWEDLKKAGFVTMNDER